MLRNVKERREWIENRNNYICIFENEFLREYESYALENGAKIIFLEVRKKVFSYDYESRKTCYKDNFVIQNWYLKEKDSQSLTDYSVSSLVDYMTKMKSSIKPAEMCEMF